MNDSQRQVPLRCSCGAVTGTATIGRAWENRAVCMCNDCQAFAHWLGRADDILDAHGGTDIFQVTPSSMRIDTGIEHIRCMRLSPKGIVRWYTGCCNTPVGNTLPDAKMPFVGLSHLFMDHGDRGRDADLGPVRCKVQAQYAIGEPPPDAHHGVPKGLMLTYVIGLAIARLKGHARPHPLFDESGKPVSEPTILTLEQRRAVTPQ